MDEGARLFSLGAVGRGRGLLGEEKGAGVNRHYLKAADPAHIARLAVPYFVEAGVSMSPTGGGLEFLASAMSMATASVDRLNEIPARLALLFDYDISKAMDDAGIRQEITAEGARAVVSALAEELAAAPRLDRDRFRAVANQVKTRTGQKAKALFHPIRIVLTGRA